MTGRVALRMRKGRMGLELWAGRTMKMTKSMSIRIVMAVLRYSNLGYLFLMASRLKD